MSLDYVLHEMGNDAYEAWWTFFAARSQLVLSNREQAQHDADMDHVAKALNRIH